MVVLVTSVTKVAFRGLQLKSRKSKQFVVKRQNDSTLRFHPYYAYIMDKMNEIQYKLRVDFVTAQQNNSNHKSCFAVCCFQTHFY